MYIARASGFVVAVALLVGCGGGGSGGSTGGGGGGGSVLTTTVALGADQALAKGTTHQLGAIATRSDGLTWDCTADAAWSSSDPAVVSVQGGLATALAEGTAQVSATCSSGTGTVSVAVTAAELVSLAVTGDTPLPHGAVTRYLATGTFTDGSTADLGAAVTWTSSDATVASVSTAAGSEGVVTAASPGTATITAEAPGGISASATIEVTDAVLVSLALSGPAALPVGLSAPAAATGTYSDASTHDLTLAVTWTSSDPAIATVSNADGTRGVVTAVATGAVVVGAELGGVPGTLDVTVIDAQLATIDVAPIDPVVQVGGTVALGATGTYTDDSTVDFTTRVAWTTSDPLVATVSAAGVVTAVAAGTATVTATDGSSGLSGTTTITVLPASVPVQLAYVTLSRGSIAGGGTVTGTVVLTRATTSPLAVTLSTSDAVATVPASVIVPAGADRATFTIQTTSPTRRKVRVKITATCDGVTKTANLNVRR
ncbi:Ig-like domain-containing protein [Anaeromyxobacter oryzae]|uniref:BIG2 domain-containing protein n=1 Tax=Anaeromyxobacter oryzae TaxID=2918170 RepID=A0ABN6MX45_9BACT|nr:Ig-like domain-containing protein [Anaeromyxobacter oryzae]BDG04093.1 hypothetical protein AMOR_30890 [Anaeromyxobacter oryzae]